VASSWLAFSGLYYKHVTIINYASSSINNLRASLHDNARVIIYDRHMFIVQPTDECHSSDCCGANFCIWFAPSSLFICEGSSLVNGNDNWPKQGILKGGKYHITVDLLFDWLGLVCFANKNKNCQLSYCWFQTSQTGGQWYSDTSPFIIPWLISCPRVDIVHLC